MQAIPLALASMSAATAVTTASAVVGGIAAISSARYQSQVAQNNATIATQNAERTRFETQVANQEQDQAAKADIGQLLASGGASGLALGVGSMGLRRKSAEQLAARDRAYTDYAGATRAAGFEQQSNDFTASASAARSEGIFGALGAGLDIGGSLISGASTVNPATASRITGSTRPRARPY
jgi:hypothetical protein